MQRRAAAGIAGIGVRTTGGQCVNFGPILGRGGGDMDKLRPIAQPELPMHALSVDHFGRTQASPLARRPRPVQFR